MERQEFFTKFASYIRSRDGRSANLVLMSELGRILVDNREDFIYVLEYSGIKIPTNNSSPASDIQLINLFVNNIANNRKLILGAAFLISHQNKQVGFDGEEYTSNYCADAASKCMTSYFCGCGSAKSSFDMMSSFEGDMDSLVFNNADGDSGAASPGNAQLLNTGLGLLGNLGNIISKKQDNNAANVNTSAAAILKAKQDAKNAIVQGAIDAKKLKLENEAKKTDAETASTKSKRTTLIVVGSISAVLVLTVATILIVKAVKAKK